MSGPADRLDALRAESRAGGGEQRVAAQHAKGKLTARERLDLLLDQGSFEETDAFVRHRSSNFGLERDRPLGDGVVTGTGAPCSRRTSRSSAAASPRSMPPRSAR
jgi:propionyl-CoA carboxylase beta chain